MRNLGRVAGWGGFYKDELKIQGYAGETTTYNPTIAGHDGRGHALMGAVGVQEAEFGTGMPGKTDPHWRSRAGLTLRVNTAELSDHVQQSGPIRDVANWSRHINAALGMGMRDAAWRHLASTPLPQVEADATMMGNLFALSTVIGLTGRPELASASLPIGVGLMMLFPNAVKAMGVVNKSYPLRETCFSFIPIMHFDRLAVVDCLTRMRRFARPIS